MSKPKSEITPMLEVPGVDGRIHAYAYEFVPSTKRPRTVYVVLDGERIATLDVDATGKFVRVPLDGYEIEIKTVPGIGQGVVLFGDERLH